MEKILVPTDFSPEAYYALDVAAEIAKYNSAIKIILLHVVEAPGTLSFNTRGEYMAPSSDQLYILKLMERAQEELTKIVTEMKYEDLPIYTKIAVGNPYKSIADEIASEGVDMIIMGSKGSSGVEELLVGSNAEKVVRLATCPVITVKNKPKDFKIRDIVFASDFTEEVPSIQNMKELQEMFFAKLHLLYVNTTVNFLPTDTIQLRMKNFATMNELENYTLNIYDAMTEEEGITKFSQSVEADIIAMGTHARKGFLHFIMGSITEDIVNHSKSMMLTFHLSKKNSVKA